MHDSERTAAHVIAHGQVQGVFYRDTIQRAAREFGVHGYAINLGDGTVECHLEGSKPDIDSVLEIASQGSPRAQVDRVDIEWIEPAGADGFRTG